MKNKIAYSIFFFLIMLFAILPLSYAQEATDSADTDEIQERVRERIDSIRRNPKAFIGVITDITDSTFQIRNQTGQIEQISISSDTSYAKLSPSATIEFEDLAIGDFQAALGYLDESSVLVSSRVLVFPEPKTITRKSVIGSITDITNTTFTLVSNDQSFDISHDRFTDVFSVQGNDIIETDTGDIEDGDQVIIIGNIEDEVLEAYHIQITKKAELEVEVDSE